MNFLSIARKFWLVIFFLAIVVFIFYDQSLIHEAWLRIAQVEASNLSKLITLQALLWTIQSFAWKETVTGLSNVSISHAKSFSHLAALVLGKYIPGKIWGIAARAGDLVAVGISRKTMLKITVYEQVLIVFSGVLVVFLGLLISHGHLSLSILALILFVVALKPMFEIAGRFWAWSIKHFSTQSTGPSSNRLQQDSRFFLQWISLLHTIAWLLQGFLIVLLASALGLSVTGNEAQIVAAHAASSLIGFAALFAPGGIGVREAAFVSILGSSFELQTLATLAILVRAWTVTADLALGLLGGAISIVLTQTKQN